MENPFHKIDRCENCKLPNHHRPDCLDVKRVLSKTEKYEIKSQDPKYNGDSRQKSKNFEKNLFIKKLREDFKRNPPNKYLTIKFMDIKITLYHEIEYQILEQLSIAQAPGPLNECLKDLEYLRIKFNSHENDRRVYVEAAKHILWKSKYSHEETGDLDSDLKCLILLHISCKEKLEQTNQIILSSMEKSKRLEHFYKDLRKLDYYEERFDWTLTTRVHTHRKDLLESSIHSLRFAETEQWRKPFEIFFSGEEAIDGGGPRKDWSTNVAAELFNPEVGLFCSSDDSRLIINPLSEYQENFSFLFLFSGRFLAKAVLDQTPVPVKLSFILLKLILGKKLDPADIEHVDLAHARGLHSLADNPLNEDELNSIPFSVNVEKFGKIEEVELVPGGKNIFVTEQNKMEYISLVCKSKLIEDVKIQLSSFLRGFHDVIPRRLISTLNEKELYLMISGASYFDRKDFQANTQYHEYTKESREIIWFWKCVEKLDDVSCLKLIKFITGSSQVPFGGFGCLTPKIQIKKIESFFFGAAVSGFPEAHTCTNQLLLPPYGSLEILEEKIKHALLNDTFGRS